MLTELIIRSLYILLQPPMEYPPRPGMPPAPAGYPVPPLPPPQYYGHQPPPGQPQVMEISILVLMVTDCVLY